MSEALRLADLIDKVPYRGTHEAAAELRRLHDLLGKANALCRIRADRIKEMEALNAELVEALRALANADFGAGDWGADAERAALMARAALAKAQSN